MMIKNLKKLRIEYSLSQQQLADIIGVSQQSINKYENHNVEPDIETLKKLAECFNTSIDYLVGYKEAYINDSEMDITESERRLVCSFRTLNINEKKSIELIINNYKQLSKKTKK